MTSYDPSLDATSLTDPNTDPNAPRIVTDPTILGLAQDAGLVACRFLRTPGVLSAAVLHANELPAVYVRAQTLDIAVELSALHELAWHAQATGHGDGTLFVHAFEGRFEGITPVTVFALGPRDPDPEVGTLDGPCGLALLLAGLIL